jgi:hypothetical protein
MRRIDKVKNKKMKNVETVEVVDKKRLRITFKNGQEIVVISCPEDYGYDSGIYIELDSI